MAQRSLRKTRAAGIKNKVILEEMGIKKRIKQKIVERKMRWYGAYATNGPQISIWGESSQLGPIWKEEKRKNRMSLGGRVWLGDGDLNERKLWKEQLTRGELIKGNAVKIISNSSLNFGSYSFSFLGQKIGISLKKKNRCWYFNGHRPTIPSRNNLI